MSDFETSVSVWTHIDDEERLRRHGCSDVLLITGIPRGKADSLVQQLIEIYRDTRLEIRDIRNVCVWSTDHMLVGIKRDAWLRDDTPRRTKQRS